ncbi:hypothetical protein BU17DRAFT_70550 [Hysterangium stoloniferum]|nr:hypothetical protein BU17DRAFT_70550 [Hysterangium stoloniferum]
MLYSAVWDQFAFIAITTFTFEVLESVLITWEGGTPPFTLAIGRVGNNVNFPFFEIPGNGLTTSSFTWKADLPGGTNFLVPPTINTNPSTNVNPSETKNTSTASQSRTSNGADSSHTGVPGQSPNNNTHTTVIGPVIGTIVGVLILLLIVGALLHCRKVRRQRFVQSSREQLTQVFGTGATLDGTPEDLASAVPEPFVYHEAPNTPLMGVDGDESRLTTAERTPSIRSRWSSAPNRELSTRQVVRRKGERFLPRLDYRTAETPPAEEVPFPIRLLLEEEIDQLATAPNRLQPEDIDRLAARMVAMMSMSTQADSRENPEQDTNSNEASAPPMYDDVATIPPNTSPQIIHHE